MAGGLILTLTSADLVTFTTSNIVKGMLPAEHETCIDIADLQVFVYGQPLGYDLSKVGYSKAMRIAILTYSETLCIRRSPGNIDAFISDKTSESFDDYSYDRETQRSESGVELSIQDVPSVKMILDAYKLYAEEGAQTKGSPFQVYYEKIFDSKDFKLNASRGTSIPGYDNSLDPTFWKD